MAMPKWPGFLGGFLPWQRPALRRNGRPGRRRRADSALRFEQLECRTLLSTGPIVLGPQTGYYDQPYVDVEFLWQDPQNPGAPPVGIGPYGSVFGWGLYPYNHFLLDTGANAILSAKEATLNLKSRGYATEGTFLELGVAGEWTEFDVSAPYRLDFEGTDGGSYTLPQTSDDVRILSSEYIELGGSIYPYGIAGVVGMPAMAGRVTTLDMSAWAEIEDIFDVGPMEVQFSDTVPPEGSHRYSVAVDDRISFDASDGLPPDSPPDAPLPSWAPVPFMTAVAGYHGLEQAGDFLLDTGAQMSMISTDLAFAIGLDEDADGDFQNEMLYSIEVGGVGGTVEVPVLLIDKISLPTQEGVDLVWTGTDPEELGLEVIVLDIGEDSGIGGVFGVDLLTSGLVFDIDPVTLDITLEGAAYFDQVHLDFRDMMSGNGTMYLDLHPNRVHITESDAATAVAEGGGGDTYEVVLWSQPTGNVTIEMASPDGQVTAVDDASPDNEHLVFTPSNWDTPQVVRVAAEDDALIEGSHVGTITHSASSTDDRYNGVRISMVTANVTDNDATEVTDRYVFYNNSKWDDPLAGRDDNDAIATDKTALRPGAVATLANYTSYVRGINGVMVDVANLPNPEAVGSGNFEFKVGNDDDPESWTPLAIEPTADVRPGQGRGGSDRIVLIWDDHTIRNEWLEVTVLADGDTGLAVDDVFYFGNAVGETGDSTSNARVDANDVRTTRNNPHPFFNPAPIDCNYDFDRNERVDSTDILIARSNQTTFFDELKRIDLSGSKAASAGARPATSSAKGDPPPLLWLGAIEPSAARHDLAVRETVLERPIGHRAERATRPVTEPAWVYEFEQTPAARRPSENERPIEAVVDWLMATGRT